MRCQRRSQRCTGACWGIWPRNTISTSSRRYLLDTICLDQGDAEVDSTEGAINDDDLINIMITVRIRLALYCCGWCRRDALVEGKGEREGAGRGACTCATSVHVRDKRGNTKTERDDEYGREPHRSAPQRLRVTSARSQVWGHTSQEASRPCRRRWIGPDVARLACRRAMMPSIHPSIHSSIHPKTCT